MTRQEVVNLSFARLMAQGCAAQAFNGSCFYSTLIHMPQEPERFCALGILVTPEFAREVEADPCINKLAAMAEKLQIEDSFLLNLQKCHDEAVDRERSFKQGLVVNYQKFCKDYNLEMPDVPVD